MGLERVPTLPSIVKHSVASYYMLINTSGGCVNMILLQIQHAAGGFTTLLKGTEYNISSSLTNGAPVIMHIDSTTENLTYTENITL